MRQVISVLSCISVLLIASNAYTFAIATKEVVLPKPEVLRVEKIACVNPHKVKMKSINAFQYSEVEAPDPFNYAYIQCKPHGEFNGSPTYFTSICNFADNKWTCDESELHISVTINNRKVDVVPGSTKPELAEDILKKISTYGAFRGRSIDKGIGNRCSFHSTSDPEELELECTDGIQLSFWCPQPEITHCPRILNMNLILN